MAARTRMMLDIDGVIANFWSRADEYYGPPERVGAYSLEEAYPSVPDDELRVWLSLPATYKDLPTVEGAVKSIHLLEEAGWDALYVTARPPHLYPLTLDWLRKVGLVDGTIASVAQLSFDNEKTLAARRYGPFGVAVEDKIENARQLAEVVPLSFLIDWDYNQGPTGNAIRVSGWDEIVGRLL